MALRLLSEALVRTGRDGEAVEVCRRLFTVDPPEPEADGSVHVRHGIRYATLAAALAGLDPNADTRGKIEDILARATLIDPDAPRTAAMIALARERLAVAAGAAAGAGVSRSPAPAD